jgi:ribokinase
MTARFWLSRAVTITCCLLARVDLLVVNREEACQLLNRDVAQHTEVRLLLQELGELLPCALLLITDGAQGAYAYDRNHFYHGHPRQDIKILETTGVGDAFSATFTAAIIKGEPVAVALDYGMTNSESVLQNKGAKGGLLVWAEVTAIAEKHLRQIDITS